MNGSSVLRLVVLALGEVLKKVSDRLAVLTFFEETYVYVGDQLFYVDVVLVIFRNSGSVQFFDKFLVVDLFDKARLLVRDQGHFIGDELAVDQVVSLRRERVVEVLRDVEVQRQDFLAFVGSEGIELVENWNFGYLAKG